MQNILKAYKSKRSENSHFLVINKNDLLIVINKMAKSWRSNSEILYPIVASKHAICP